MGWAFMMDYFGWKKAGVVVEKDDAAFLISVQDSVMKWLGASKMGITLPVVLYMSPTEALAATGTIAKTMSDANVRIVWANA